MLADVGEHMTLYASVGTAVVQRRKISDSINELSQTVRKCVSCQFMCVIRTIILLLCVCTCALYVG